MITEAGGTEMKRHPWLRVMRKIKKKGGSESRKGDWNIEEVDRWESQMERMKGEDHKETGSNVEIVELVRNKG